MRGSRDTASVTFAENAVRSTASAWPAGTAQARAISRSNDPARRISSFNSQGAVFSLSDFSEFEHTSSANSAGLMRGRRAHRTHLAQLDRDAAARALPRRFGAR